MERNNGRTPKFSKTSLVVWGCVHFSGKKKKGKWMTESEVLDQLKELYPERFSRRPPKLSKHLNYFAFKKIKPRISESGEREWLIIDISRKKRT